MYTNSYTSTSTLRLPGMYWDSNYIYAYSNTLQSRNNNQTRTSKGTCGGLRLCDLTPICATFHKNSTQALNITHKMSLYFTAPLIPLNPLSNTRHITTILLQAVYNSISTARTFSFSISKAPSQFLNICWMWGCQQLCKLFVVKYLMFTFSVKYICLLIFMWQSCMWG